MNQPVSTRPCTLVLLLLILGLSIRPATAADVLRERELAHELEQRAFPGEMIWLDAQGARFPALYRDAATKETHGAIVLLHDTDTGADAPELLQPLRTRLPDRGWATLALQAPAREPTADVSDYLPLLPETLARIDAALRYLGERKIENRVLLGYRQGGFGVLRYLDEKPDGNVRAAVLLNLRPTGDAGHDALLLEALGKVSIPLLDILGGKPSAGEEDLIQQRRSLMKANPAYRITLLADTRAGLDDVTDMLVNRIHGWLMQTRTNAPAKDTSK